MPAATETFRLSMRGSISSRARWSHCSATSRRRPSPSLPSTRTMRGGRSSVSSAAGAGRVQADDPVAALLEVGQGAAEIDHLDQRHEVERARGRLGAGAAELGAAAIGQDDALHAECRGRAQDGAEIARVVDLVQGQDQRALRRVGAELRRVAVGQGPDAQRPVPDAAHSGGRSWAMRSAGTFSGVIARAPGGGLDRREGRLGGQHAVAGPVGIGQGGGDGMLAVEPDPPGRGGCAARPALGGRRPVA